MSRNKVIRKQIRGHLNNIEAHYRKIKQELAEEQPDKDMIRKWREKDIPKAQREIEKLERKLPGGKR